MNNKKILDYLKYNHQHKYWHHAKRLLNKMMILKAVLNFLKLSRTMCENSPAMVELANKLESLICEIESKSFFMRKWHRVYLFPEKLLIPAMTAPIRMKLMGS
jgi:hypothetical protein